MSRYRHFTIAERESLLGYLKQGKKNCEIAKLLNRSPSTISRELHRNAKSRSKYSALQAQKAYEHRRKRSVRKCKLARQDFAEKVSELLGNTWSPEQISKRLQYEHNPIQVSISTIYRGLERGLLDCALRKTRWKEEKQVRASGY